MRENTPRDFDDYLKRYPADVQDRLRRVRETIRKAAPKAKETISYSIPAFTLDGMLVWFAAHKNHIGFYPGASGIRAFKKELADYKHAKGSVKFPLDEPLPLALIRRIVKFRVKERLASRAARKPEKSGFD
ncbi:MAG: DUF1801 domain-containing protein [Candidatus Eremiobacteraeota bacterium]|nr:DUF1801 domain-containing protein [Candidatus Eremiobacteraeota bacterium]MBV8354142.1 DUF1801 domain-containing protein [Candidatus Eremiobacteraeota bacterium]